MSFVALKRKGAALKVFVAIFFQLVSRRFAERVNPVPTGAVNSNVNSVVEKIGFFKAMFGADSQRILSTNISCGPDVCPTTLKREQVFHARKIRPRSRSCHFSQRDLNFVPSSVEKHLTRQRNITDFFPGPERSPNGHQLGFSRKIRWGFQAKDQAAGVQVRSAVGSLTQSASHRAC
jgi:hypothetical protein